MVVLRAGGRLWAWVAPAPGEVSCLLEAATKRVQSLHHACIVLHGASWPGGIAEAPPIRVVWVVCPRIIRSRRRRTIGVERRGERLLEAATCLAGGRVGGLWLLLRLLAVR